METPAAVYVSVIWPPEKAGSGSKAGILPNNKKPPGRVKEEHTPCDRRLWKISEKRRLVAEAHQYGIRATARYHDMAFSTLRVWTKQDFGDMPGDKKRLPGGGRRLKYDRSVDLALREWVLQRVAEEEHVTRDEIKRKAFDMILPHNPNFQASNGWISRFLTRHKLSINSKSSFKAERQIPDTSQIEQQTPSSQVEQQSRLHNMYVFVTVCDNQ